MLYRQIAIEVSMLVSGLQFSASEVRRLRSRS
jgi:hypothetical protein